MKYPEIQTINRRFSKLDYPLAEYMTIAAIVVKKFPGAALRVKLVQGERCAVQGIQLH